VGWDSLSKCYNPTGKMTVFGAIFEVKSSIGKLWVLLGHFDKKDTVDFNKCHFLLNNFVIVRSNDD